MGDSDSSAEVDGEGKLDLGVGCEFYFGDICVVMVAILVEEDCLTDLRERIKMLLLYWTIEDQSLILLMSLRSCMVSRHKCWVETISFGT